MIYVIKNLSTTYDIVVSSLDDLPQTATYEIIKTNEPFEYFVNKKLFANITHMPNNLISKPTSIDNLEKTINSTYYKNSERILLENKNKFIIAMIQFKPDNTKDVLYANSYINLLKDTAEYHKLKEDSPHHHYEILNYQTSKFEVHIKREDAIEKLNQYMNKFIIDYKPNIVKEFSSKEEFLEYIKL